jgi:hypothetical protein
MANRPGVTAGAAMLTALVCACGPSPVPTATSTPSPSPAARHLIAIDHRTTSPAQDIIELVDLGGHVVASHAITETSAPPPSHWFGYGPRGVYVVDASGSVSVLGADGAFRAEGSIPVSVDQQVIGIAGSPDGTHWIAAVVAYQPDLSATTTIYDGTGVAPPRVVATLTRASQDPGPQRRFLGGYGVLRWDARGVLLGSRPTGVGGNGPYIDEGYGLATVVRLDPATGAVSAPLTTDCRFEDAAPDGTVACVAGSDVRIRRTDGTASTIHTGARWLGHVAFMGTSSKLTYATAAYTDANETTWTHTLHGVSLSGTTSPQPTVIASGLSPEFQTAFAFTCVVDSSAVVGLTAQSGDPSTYLSLFRAGAPERVLAPADNIIGVLTD